MNAPIAVVGMACIYPDARSPVELWENALAQRRAFRRIPSERLRLEDYLSPDHAASDQTYSVQAAVIEGYEFDREKYRVVGSTFRATDLAHWLALDVASQALDDAGFADGAGLPKEATGVLVGNTLTGEFSRANVMRLRWPYVRRVIDAKLTEEGWELKRRAEFLRELEQRYKEPFPAVGDETLAGGLSNTIAGRICNHFDLGGGGYTIDGACSSSLLATANACSALAAGDIGVALAGGVDLSLDPFELVGFSRVGALAEDEMRVYDASSTGFLPGEGCGFMVLMRHEEAVKHNLRVYAVIKGWGISSDGSGGLTRPETAGQRLAINRAYRRAGYGPETVGYFEGHGTGTTIGDQVELSTISTAVRENKPDITPAAVGSIKANLGHTKAAAGIAGLIKATMAVHAQIIPPHTGFRKPHAELSGENPALTILPQGQRWHSNRPIRAGVSSMGFGGINVHITLESAAAQPRSELSSREKRLLSSAQDAELLLLGASDAAELEQRIDRLLRIAPHLSQAEIADLAATLSSQLEESNVRAAIVASSANELTERLETLSQWLSQGITSKVDVTSGVFLGSGSDEPRIGFLFPGQASPAHLDGSALRRRFETVHELYEKANLPVDSDGIETSVAQPAIVTACLAALRVLNRLNVTASKSVGHSLGELTAYHWAGVFDEEALLRIATARGRVMTEFSGGNGAMASIGADRATVEEFLKDTRAVIAGLNSPTQTVVSGEEASVARVVNIAQEQGLRAVLLPVSHAFHSPLMAPVEQPLAEALGGEHFQSPRLEVLSTITGAPLDKQQDLKELLCRQLLEPVRFHEPLHRIASEVDLLVEVGPGEVLSGLAHNQVDVPLIPLDAGGQSLQGLLKGVGAAYALGVKINHQALFADRFTRPFDLDKEFLFFANPCELAPTASLPELDSAPSLVGSAHDTSAESSMVPSLPETIDALSLVKQLVAAKTELPVSALADNSRFLDDLHLNSIAVSQLATEAAGRLKLPPLAAPNQFADATLTQMAEALDNLRNTSDSSGATSLPFKIAGVDSWIRSFTVELVKQSLPLPQQPSSHEPWQILAASDEELADAVREKLDEWGGGGYILCLPADLNENHITRLLQATGTILEAQKPTMLVFVQHGAKVSSLAKTLHLEVPDLTTCVVNVPLSHEAADWVVAEVKSAVGFTETVYDESGSRWVPVLRPVLDKIASKNNPDDSLLGSSEVLLVTGGGKGIAAECAMRLAEETGVRLALMGRSRAEGDTELASNLERFKARNVSFCYLSADVTDPEAVKRAVAEIEQNLGSITGFLHGAGTNDPKLLRDLDETSFRKTVATKVRGAQNVLAAVNPDRLKLFVTFGSIIARTGMRGEADYAVANEWLTRLTEMFHVEHPHCRCLALEWSVWSGVGMGERLGRIESLVQQGVTPITPDEGVATFLQLLNSTEPSAPSVIVTGRFGEPPTLQVDKPELPLYRFLEKPQVYYPGIELIVVTELSAATDPYLNDHIFRGERLWPAVIGLEAMAQAAMALADSERLPVFEDVHFERPVVVPAEGSVTIRVAALVREPGVLELVLRSEETAFQTDHFRARCRFEVDDAKLEDTRTKIDSDVPTVPLVPQKDLYDNILFHRGRFQRLSGYRRLKATECLAEVTPNGTADWFGRYLPQSLVLGDPAVRDAAIHAIQACVPHASLLPIGCERITVASLGTDQQMFVRATERDRQDDLFTYDMELVNSDGRICEQWVGLKLQMISGSERHDDWVAPLLGPYMERMINDIISGVRVSIAIDQNGNRQRQTASQQAVRRAVGDNVAVSHRPDGKPEVNNGCHVSVAHAADITMAVACGEAVACDIEAVAIRTAQVWQKLLGTERFTLAELLAGETGENIDTAATRVWSATECLKKAGVGIEVPLVLSVADEDGWVQLDSGRYTIGTYLASVRDRVDPLVLAVLTRHIHESV